jgi:hypothetical protein
MSRSQMFAAANVLPDPVAICHVSRPHLIKLLDRGEIPHFRTDERAGAHRRVYMEDVLRYREGRNEHRRKKLAELTQRSAEYEGTWPHLKVCADFPR